MYPDKFVNSAADVPKVEHFALFVSDSYYTEGDERSRTHPGHGYPASTNYIIQYQAFLTKEKLLSAIADLEKNSYKKEYCVCKITPMTVEKTISLELK